MSRGKPPSTDDAMMAQHAAGVVVIATRSGARYEFDPAEAAGFAQDLMRAANEAADYRQRLMRHLQTAAVATHAAIRAASKGQR